MISTSVVFACVLASAALAAPTAPHSASPTSAHHHAEMPAWDAGAAHDFQIHSSCNSTETIQLRKGLADAVTLAEHAKDHVLRYGNGSEHYRKYFGEASSGEVIGWYEKIVNGDKAHALFRCDDPDGNCVQPEWGGHWRGENGTNETVICPLSYETRRPLEQLCAMGYTVAEGATNTYFGSDLLHRLYHIPSFGEGHVEHFADDYAEVLALARDNSSYSTHDSDVLQYFALDVYAYDIAIPSTGCPGVLPTATASESSAAETSSSSSMSTTGTPTSMAHAESAVAGQDSISSDDTATVMPTVAVMSETTSASSVSLSYRSLH
ncbi:MAG: hypothetical protein M1817_002794 [Caeruleum heppii]|nr:MAG: hypothetical protein M1817_002794 [Caeruleum heppii]